MERCFAIGRWMYELISFFILFFYVTIVHSKGYCAFHLTYFLSLPNGFHVQLRSLTLREARRACTSFSRSPGLFLDLSGESSTCTERSFAWSCTQFAAVSSWFCCFLFVFLLSLSFGSIDSHCGLREFHGLLNYFLTLSVRLYCCFFNPPALTNFRTLCKAREKGVCVRLSVCVCACGRVRGTLEPKK